MKTVFVIQSSPGKNFEPAKEFGGLTIMLDGNESTSQATNKLLNHLESFDPTTDYLLLVGNPIYIAVATMILTDIAYDTRQKIKLLVWDKHHYKYNVEAIYA